MSDKGRKIINTILALLVAMAAWVFVVYNYDPMTKEKFAASYEDTDAAFNRKLEYVPRIYTQPEGAVYDLAGYIRPCVPSQTSFIYAKRLVRDVKLFTKWYEEKYMKGSSGDYIACRTDDVHDFYIIRSDIFDMTYSPVS